MGEDRNENAVSIRIEKKEPCCYDGASFGTIQKKEFEGQQFDRVHTLCDSTNEQCPLHLADYACSAALAFTSASNNFELAIDVFMIEQGRSHLQRRGQEAH